MTPQFKIFMVLLTLVLLCGSGIAFAEATSFKLCFSATKADGEIGCYNGTKAVSFHDWLKKIDPKLTFVRAELLTAGVVKVFYR